MGAARVARGSRPSAATEESAASAPAALERLDDEAAKPVRSAARAPARGPGGRIRLLLLALAAAVAAGICVSRLRAKHRA